MAELSSSAVDGDKRGFVRTEFRPRFTIVRLDSLPADPTNRLSLDHISELGEAIKNIGRRAPDSPIILTGNDNFFSAGADLNEIAAMIAPEAYEFAKVGQGLLNLIASHHAPVIAAISGYCMGGGLDLALACHYRIATPGTVFGHRGAALGILTGLGGTQRLPRLVGKARALQIFLAAEKISAPEALRIGIIDEIAGDVLSAAKRIAESGAAPVS